MRRNRSVETGEETNRNSDDDEQQQQREEKRASKQQKSEKRSSIPFSPSYSLDATTSVNAEDNVRKRTNVEAREEEAHLIEVKTNLMDRFREFMQGKQINIPQEEVERLLTTYGKAVVSQALSALIVSDFMEFPYKRYFVTNIQEKFDGFRKYRGKLLYDQAYALRVRTKTDFLKPFHYLGRYLLLPSEKTEYESIQILGEVFMEQPRVKSVVKGKPSCMSYWRSASLHPFWLPAVFDPPRAINTHTLREALFETSSEPSSFKATVAATVYRFFHATRILDFCSGWGDRLLGALSCEDELEVYVGVDPNLQLQTGYLQMIKQFSKDSSKFLVCPSPFETCELPCQDFDLIFTGPPYFDYELYGDGTNQSTTSFPSLQDWVVKFLFTCAHKAWDVLRENGVMAINIDEVHIAYVEVFMLWIQACLPGARYEGVLSFCGANTKIPRPIWVYRKVASESTIGLAADAKMLLLQHYSLYWSEWRKHVASKSTSSTTTTITSQTITLHTASGHYPPSVQTPPVSAPVSVPADAHLALSTLDVGDFSSFFSMPLT